MDPLGNGYDIYDLYDLGEFDQKGAVATKWGTRQELEDLIYQAAALDIKIIWDAVLNHKAGADFPETFSAVEVDPKRRDIEISPPSEIDGWVGFDFDGRGDVYSAMKYRWQHFTGVDWDQKREKQAIYKVHAPHKDWASDVSPELGNYDYLMFANLDLSHPEVRNDLLKWGTWITQTLSLGGMRLDAAKHFSAQFQKDFAAHVRRTANPDLFVIGEYWTADVKAIEGYLDQVENTIVAYDVPLVERFSKISHIRHADLRGIFRDTLVQRRPDQAVTIVCNHDTQPGQMLETPVAPAFKLLAYALTLLRKDGRPSVFYGDIYGILGGNHSTPVAPPCNVQIPLLTRARKLYAYGEQEDYFDQPNCIGFVRYGNARHRSGLVCIISNAGASKKRMFVGRSKVDQEWVDILGNQPNSVLIDKWGYGMFTVGGMSASVWVESAAVVSGGMSTREKFNLNFYDY
ncbi:putative alpha-amylase [Penicillium oxalicum 114-2]|uniref:Putative alpha-amylase n=1 Tax=Penicillium oxalicum (strain 114-2 / CGMCC 5302) TaxID=933388 RepID=S8AUB8_PENO1|nr:putative alpha-amylase [Penicillium oxalicum 114-2]